MTKNKVFSVCGMCTVRCPISVEVENGQVGFIAGNPHVPAMKGAVCPRGLPAGPCSTTMSGPRPP